MGDAELPEGWNLRRVGDCLKLQNGYPFKPTDWSTSGDPIIRIQNLNSLAASYNFYQGRAPDRFRARYGDLLFAWSGTPGTSFGAHVWTGGDAWINQHIFRVDFSDDDFDRDFLRFALNHNLSSYVAEAQGGVGLAHITKAKLNDSLLITPPLEAQRSIADVLEKIDLSKRRALERLGISLRAVERLRHAILTAACSGRLTSGLRDKGSEFVGRANLDMFAERRRDGPGRRYREPELNRHASGDDLPETWVLAPLGLLLSSVKYGTSVRSEYGAAGTPVLRIPNVSGKSFDASDLKFAELSPREETELSLEPGDLLMIRSNGSVQLLGKSMLVPDTAAGMAYAGYLMRLRPDPLAIDARYLEIALASPAVRNQIEIPVRSTSGVHNINTDEVRGLGIPLPPLPEQLEVTSRAVNLLQRVTSIQQQIERAAASVGRTSQAALSKAFRGELVAATDQ